VDLGVKPVRLTAEKERRSNPIYEEVQRPKPFTEQFAWMIYTALSVSSLGLLGILVLLGRKAVRLQEAEQAATRS
jgi:hypothetical protein